MGFEDSRRSFSEIEDSLLRQELGGYEVNPAFSTNPSHLVLSTSREGVAFNQDKTHRNADQRYQQRRAASLKQHTDAQWRERLELWRYRCAYCAQPLTYETATKDHVVALAMGGHNGILNIVPACLDCNRKKRAGVALDIIRFGPIG